MNPPTIPPRREFKFLVDRKRLPELRAAIAPYCDPDPNGGPDGTYALRSLYLDAPHLPLFHANESEAPERFKARIRTYIDAPDSPVFSELKFRSGDVIRKVRAVLPEDWQTALRSGGALDPFTARMHRYGLEPMALVEYRRGRISRRGGFGQGPKRTGMALGVELLHR